MPQVDPNYQAQVDAWRAEQERQRQIALQQLQHETDIHTHAQQDINSQAYAAQQARDAAAQKAAMDALQAKFAGEGNLQTSALTAQQARQQELAKSQAGLQSQIDIEAQKRQHEAEVAQAGRDTAQQQSAKERQTQAEAAAQGLLGSQAQFQREAEERRNASVTGLFNSFNSNYGGAINGAIGGGGAGGGAAGGLAAVGGEDAARQAAFATAKDQAGQIGRSSMTALQNTMGARGLTGSGLAVNQAGGVIGEGARQLGDVNRTQLTDTLTNARQRAAEQYQGGITMRGQNIGAISSLANLYNGARAY